MSHFSTVCDIGDDDDLSVVSQQLSLHHYPTHALATLSAPLIISVLDERAHRYVALCQAHSRMVLRLQALIHSALSPVSEELDDPALRYRNTAQQVGRELVFPAPLFFSTEEKNRNQGLQLTTRRRHIRFFSLPTTSARSRPLEDEPVKRSRSRLSMLGRRKVPLPPPSADPLGLKLYAGSWRGWRRAVAASCSASEDDETLFRRPSRHFACTTDSSRSSTDNSHGSPSPHSSRLTEFIPTSPTVHGAHDIRVATSRFRAPILRVYFPCSELDQDAITACEAQLDDAGLWQHLSVGDVVCNLGYLPSEETQGSSSSELSADGKRGPESWMIFDGMGLVPYTPSAVLPLSEPLTLPSPFYYAHIIPPPFNPKFVAILPHEVPELSLVHLPSRVRSPNSPNGFARIKKYMWLAHLRPHSRPDFGEGWQCAWILEGEGTKEGRQSLLDALCGDASGEREWELIMEKSTPSRIWLRFVHVVLESFSELMIKLTFDMPDFYQQRRLRILPRFYEHTDYGISPAALHSEMIPSLLHASPEPIRNIYFLPFVHASNQLLLYLSFLPCIFLRPPDVKITLCPTLCPTP